MAGGDVRLRLQPGEDMPVTTPGDYIYLKQADRDIRVTITDGQGVQKPVVMTAGDKYRPGPFRALNIANTSSTRPAQIVMVIGEGDFNRQIVQGEIVVDPRIKTADGSYVPDQRETHQVAVTMDYRKEPAQAEHNLRVIQKTDELAWPVNGALEGLAWDQELGAWKCADYAMSGTNGKRYHAITIRPGGAVESVPLVSPSGSGNYVYAVAYLGNGQWIDAPTDRNIWIQEEGRGERTLYREFGTQYLARLWVMDSGEIWAYSNNDKKVYNIDQKAVVFDAGFGSEVWAPGVGNQLYRFNDSGLEVEVYEPVDGVWQVVETIQITSPVSVGACESMYYDRSRQELVTVDDQPEGPFNTLYGMALRGYEAGELHLGKALETCVKLPGLFNPALDSYKSSFANISVQWQNGKAYASGEVIRYVLDLLGIDTSGEYLDSITGFEAKTKNRRIAMDLGGRTFAADKIADDWQQVELPQVVTIKALNRLWRTQA